MQSTARENQFITDFEYGNGKSLESSIEEFGTYHDKPGDKRYFTKNKFDRIQE